MAASRNISMFFKQSAAASENILTTASEIYQKKKMSGCFLEICPLKKLFWGEKLIKIKTR